MSFEEKMKQDLKKDLEEKESVDNSGGSCGGDRCIRNGSLFQSGTGEEYPGDRRCLCKNAGKQGEGSVCRER